MAGFDNLNKSRLKRSTGLLNLSLREQAQQDLERPSAKRTYLILPNVTRDSHKHFKLSKNSRLSRVHNTIENDVKNWLPFKDEEVSNDNSSTPSRSSNSIFSTIRLVQHKSNSLKSVLQPKPEAEPNPFESFTSTNSFNSSAFNPNFSFVSHKKDMLNSTIRLVGANNNELNDSQFKFTFSTDKPNLFNSIRDDDATPIFLFKNILPGSKPSPNRRSRKSSYKFVRPLQTAFLSTGLVSKSSLTVTSTPNPLSPFVMNKNQNIFGKKLPPDTPRKNHIFGTVEKPRSRLSETYIEEDIFGTKFSMKKPSLGDDIILDSPNDKLIELLPSSIPSPNFLKKSNRFLKFELPNKKRTSSEMDISPSLIDKILSPIQGSNRRLKEKLRSVSVNWDEQREKEQEDPASDANSDIVSGSLRRDTIFSHSQVFESDMFNNNTRVQQRTEDNKKKENNDPPVGLSSSNVFNPSKNIFNRNNSSTSLVRLPNFKSTKDLFDTSFDMEITTPTKSVKRKYNEEVIKTPNSSLLNVGEASGNQEPQTVTPSSRYLNPQLDQFLFNKFNNDLRIIGEGEFSVVYQCDYKHLKFCIKKVKKHVKRTPKYQANKSQALTLSNNEKEFIMDVLGNDVTKINYSPDEEIEILNTIKKNRCKGTGSEYLINYISNFNLNNHNYIVMEYCENGSLDKFLLKNSHQKLDEFRVWKILTEIVVGLNFLHENGILHLDLKPANVFINFEGSLKIGDFGMAHAKGNSQHGPVDSPAHGKRRILRSAGLENNNRKHQASLSVPEVDKEGDREYIAPEILLSCDYNYPADIFSLGLIIVEIAANIYLPDNGLSWQKLRSGDLSDAGKLSFRDLAIHQGNLASESLTSTSTCVSNQRELSNLTDMSLFNNLAPITFLRDGQTLDTLVHWMIEPIPKNRPTANELSNLFELQYIELKRNSGSIVYEGDYGPTLNFDDPVEVEEDFVFNHMENKFSNDAMHSSQSGENNIVTVGEYLNNFNRVKDVYYRQEKD